MNRGRARPAAVAVLVALATASGACHRASDDPTVPLDSTPPAPSAAATPVDHLAPGELLEGKAEAFGLRLPRDVAIEGAFRDLVIASGPVLLHPVVQYLRARLQGGNLREGEMSATFDDVRVAAKPGPPLHIHVGVAPDGVRLEVRDETPPELPALPDEVSRWRRVGLTPDGRLADPTHME
jgi:hypothetical protein